MIDAMIGNAIGLGIACLILKAFLDCSWNKAVTMFCYVTAGAASVWLGLYLQGRTW